MLRKRENKVILIIRSRQLGKTSNISFDFLLIKKDAHKNSERSHCKIEFRYKMLHKVEQSFYYLHNQSFS